MSRAAPWSAAAGGVLGGLSGWNGGTIRASYSSASVEAGGTGATVGGLVGNMNGGAIIASYAAGAVTGAGATAIGGFVARVTGAGSAITDSYCDTGAAGQANCIGAQSSGAAVAAAGHSSTTLQTPVGYTGIYANWNLDLDGDTFPDYLWNFGATTTYPTLYKPTERQAAAALVVDYDQDNDNLIDITNPHQLNALRYDPDGNGLPDNAAHYSAYTGGFPNGNISDTSTPYLGCQSTCIGYELMANLDFAADGAAVTAADDYPNWTPIPSYQSTFDGKGNTITRLTITGATGNSGLFNTLASGGVIRDVGMVDASIGNNGADARVGILAGDNDGGMIITSYASGGAVTITGTSTYAGGLIGRNAGDVRAVYSTASVTASSTATTTIGGLIGLHAGSVHRILRRRHHHRQRRRHRRRVRRRRQQHRRRHNQRLLRHRCHRAIRLHRRPDRRRNGNLHRLHHHPTPDPHGLHRHLRRLEHPPRRGQYAGRPLELRHQQPIPDHQARSLSHA